MAEGSSTLLIEECFEQADPELLRAVLACRADRWLGTFARRWYRDTRPFARAALLGFIDDGCDQPQHRALVKHLFKDAEEAGDDEVMAHFMVALDRCLPRHEVVVDAWDQAAQDFIEVRRFPVDDALPRSRSAAEAFGRFSIKTRRYLRRRVWRYARRVGKADPARYRRLAEQALVAYRDAHFGEIKDLRRLFDASSLAQMLFMGNPAVRRRVGGDVVLEEGAALETLAAAPWLPEAWQSDGAGLVRLACNAPCRLVREGLARLIERVWQGRFGELPLLEVERCIRHAEPALQRLGAELLGWSPALDTLGIEVWRRLLAVRDPIAAARVCELAAPRIIPAVLTLAQLIDLACVPAQPVAELALGWAQERAVRDRASLDELVRLADAASDEVRIRAVAWVVEELRASPEAQMEHARALIDSRAEDVRMQGIGLVLDDERLRGDVRLWAAMSESPWPSVRDVLIRLLDGKHELPALEAADLHRLWATTVLSVRRGARERRVALVQIAARLGEHPEEAEVLAPLLTAALRSVRGADRAAAVTAIARAVRGAPAHVTALLAHHAPELTLGEVLVC